MAFRDMIPWKREEKPSKEEKHSIMNDPSLGLAGWVENLFDDPFFDLETTGSKRFYPEADICETENEYTVSIDLPGLDENDIEVLFQKNTLIVRGNKEEKREEKNKQYVRIERRSGAFQRSFVLPDDVDGKKIDADFKNGVLNVHLAKSESGTGKHKRIPIQKK